jgi:hypothetical protein
LLNPRVDNKDLHHPPQRVELCNRINKPQTKIKKDQKKTIRKLQFHSLYQSNVESVKSPVTHRLTVIDLLIKIGQKPKIPWQQNFLNYRLRKHLKVTKVVRKD